MLKRAALLILTIVLFMPAYAQQVAPGNDTLQQANNAGNHLRVSLLTCGPGEEVYETFGHSCIRITDSAKSGRERDVVYNYGFVTSSEDNTVLHQFLTGRLQVFLATNTFDEFTYQYTNEKRGVTEQVFLLDNEQKGLILSFLKNNLRKENRYYEYNTMYDNCSTRIRDMFIKIFGSRFVPGQVIPKDSHLTFRELTSKCGPKRLQHKYWYALAMEILFSSRTDKIASNMEALYLADYLMDGMDGAALDGKKLCSGKTTLFEEKISWPPAIDTPLITLFIVALLTISGLLVKRLHLLGSLMSLLVLLATGVLGYGIFYLSTIDTEPAWKDNFGILWALPANIIIPFLGPRTKRIYAIIALLLLGVSLVLHISGIQQIPLSEITPLLLTLVFIYGMMFRKANRKIKHA